MSANVSDCCNFRLAVKLRNEPESKTVTIGTCKIRETTFNTEGKFNEQQMKIIHLQQSRIITSSMAGFAFYAAIIVRFV